MTRRTITLTERRTRAVKLPRTEAHFLLAHARNLIDVVPAFERGVYRLTPRGYVGFIDGPAARYAIGPKIPWPNVEMLLGLKGAAGTDATEPAGGPLAVLAAAFAERLEKVTRKGLVAGYGEDKAVSQFLRGKLRTTDQMRDAAARAFPDHFHIDEPTFDLHTPWNRVPKAVAALLFRHELSRELRRRVQDAVAPLAVLPNAPFAEADFTAARAEPCAAGYRKLLDVCRILIDGLTCADPLATGSGAFLVDLGLVFERYLTTAIECAFGPQPGWGVEAQPAFAIGPAELRPDVLLRKDGAPWAVLDAKWKTAALDSADLHQILAYATLTDAARVALVYPGRNDECATSPRRAVGCACRCTGCGWWGRPRSSPGRSKSWPAPCVTTDGIGTTELADGAARGGLRARSPD